MMKGIDVSTWNTSVDYNAVKRAGIDVVIIRAGYGRETYQKDNMFESHYANAKKAGLKIGAYWYSYADGVADAKKEAQACLQCLGGKSLDLPIYFDMEESSQTAYGRTTLTNMAIAFCDTIVAGGYRAGVYSNANWFNNYLNYSTLKSKYSIWLAQWSSSHSISCDIWQYADDGKISGCSGNFDMNIIENPSIINGESEEEEMIEYGKTNLATLAFKKQLLILKNLGVIKTRVDDTAGFGDGTKNAVLEVQKIAKIDVDGIVGKDTINAVFNLINTPAVSNKTKIENIKKALA